MRDELDTSAFGTRRASAAVAYLIERTRAQPDSWLGRRLAYFFRRLAIRRLAGPVDSSTIGANFRLYPFSNVCEKRILFTPQYFDQEERDLIASRVKPGFVFLDIGANIGGYALSIAAAAGPTAKIVAIEPQPQIFERLVYNIAQNPFGTVKAVACAIADHDGELTLFLNHENRGQSSVKIVASDQDGGGTVLVPAKTLLTLLNEEKITRVDAAKLDVEGAEDLILEPFFKEAPRSLWPKLMVVENIEGRWHKDVRALLVEHGYKKLLANRRNVAFELE